MVVKELSPMTVKELSSVVVKELSPVKVKELTPYIQTLTMLVQIHFTTY